MNRFFILVFILLYQVSFSQQDSISNQAFYERYSGKLSTKMFTLNRSNDFELYDENADKRILLTPNRKTSLGFSANYDILAFSIGFAPAFLTENRDNKNSKLLSFSTDLFLGPWIQHLDLFYQKGMTLELLNEPSIYLENLKTFKVGGSTSFNFNPNFSYKAKNFENERQLKSTGSFIPSLVYYYTSLQQTKEVDYDTKARFINLAVAPAYHYNWVIDEHFLVSGGLSLGLGLTQTIDSDRSVTTLLTTSSIDLSVGYNTDNFYAGIISNGTLQKQNNGANVVGDDTIRSISFLVGYRFNAPQFVKDANRAVYNFFSRNN
ncbi:uncharacterized protein DUF4421 [Mesonia algae]|uniref:Uncharacterized protein DUF4421 n=1 Tax=Mesonia algae TaxID=213248 RepID=A0A2W7I0W4_9FLAO|nr:DUF4421 family protein [Mesonia algae]PZW40561.1 uncharacterized protein DUF4421 [Mesonia algae]